MITELAPIRKSPQKDFCISLNARQFRIERNHIA
jgi:hypothetical protein